MSEQNGQKVGIPKVVPIVWVKKYLAIRRAIDEQLLLGLETPGQGLTLDDLQTVVEHRYPVTKLPELPMSLRGGKKILGSRRVIGANLSIRVWSKSGVSCGFSQDALAIRYKAETLIESARQNQEEGTNWRLMFVSGLSLRQQRQIRGTDREKQPCFWKESTWWLNGKEDFWAASANQPGYYLIDFKGRWGGLTWDAQEVELAKLGSQFERVNPHVFGEAILTNFLVNNQERLAENWYHWSGVADSCGIFVYVGDLDVGALFVFGSGRGNYSSDLRVCLFRKFDF